MAEEVLRVLGEAYEEIDDSDGVVGEAAAAVAEVHLEACRVARPDPERLAEWLEGRLLADDSEVTDLDPLDVPLAEDPYAVGRSWPSGARP